MSQKSVSYTQIYCYNSQRADAFLFYHHLPPPSATPQLPLIEEPEAGGEEQADRHGHDNLSIDDELENADWPDTESSVL
jgi:hypothetical protein